MDRKNLKDDWPLPNNYLVELGRISALFGVLENIVNISIHKLSGFTGSHDYRTSIILAHINFKQRLDILETLFEQTAKEYPHLQRYPEVMKLIERSQKGRNKFVHNSLGCKPGTSEVTLAILSARGTLKTNVEKVYIQELKEVSATIHEASCALLSLLENKELKPMWDREDAQ